MYEPNVQRILQSLSPKDVVLDIGGWASPFNRANGACVSILPSGRSARTPSIVAGGLKVESMLPSTLMRTAPGRATPS